MPEAKNKMSELVFFQILNLIRTTSESGIQRIIEDYLITIGVKCIVELKTIITSFLGQ